MDIRHLLQALFSPFPAPPPFRFDRELFQKLIREKDEGGSLDHGEDPEVEFTMGPMDGKLGSFDRERMRIEVDVLEVFVHSAAGKGFVSAAQIRNAFDAEMTRVLAHEGGHWHLEKRQGIRAFYDKFAILAALALLGLAASAGLGGLWWMCVMSPALFAAGGLPGPFGLLAAMGAWAVSWILGVNLLRRFLGIWGALSFALTYQVCWHERHARRFEKRTKDPRWDGVVQV